MTTIDAATVRRVLPHPPRAWLGRAGLVVVAGSRRRAARLVRAGLVADEIAVEVGVSGRRVHTVTTIDAATV